MDIVKLRMEIVSMLNEAFGKSRHGVQTHPACDAIGSMQRAVYSAMYEVPEDPLWSALNSNNPSDFAVAVGGVYSETILFFLVLPDTPTHEVLPVLSGLSGTNYVGLIKGISARDDIQTRCKLGLKWIGHIVICGELQLGRFEVHIGVIPVGNDSQKRSAILPDKLFTSEERRDWIRRDPSAKFINVFEAGIDYGR